MRVGSWMNRWETTTMKDGDDEMDRSRLAFQREAERLREWHGVNGAMEPPAAAPPKSGGNTEPGTTKVERRDPQPQISGDRPSTGAELIALAAFQREARAKEMAALAATQPGLLPTAGMGMQSREHTILAIRRRLEEKRAEYADFMTHLEFRKREGDLHGCWDAAVNASEVSSFIDGLEYALAQLGEKA